MWCHTFLLIINCFIILAQDAPNHERRHFRTNIEPTYSRNTPFQNEESFPAPVFGIAHGHPFNAVLKDTLSEFQRSIQPVESCKKFSSEMIPSKREDSPHRKYYNTFFLRNPDLKFDSRRRERLRKIPIPQLYSIDEFPNGVNRKRFLIGGRGNYEGPPFHEPLKRDNEDSEQKFYEGPWEWNSNRNRPSFNENIRNKHSFLRPWPPRPPNDGLESKHGDGSSSEAVDGKCCEDPGEKIHRHFGDGKGMIGNRAHNYSEYGKIVGMDKQMKAEQYPFKSRQEFNIGHHCNFALSTPFQNVETSTTIVRGPKRRVMLQNKNSMTINNNDYEEETPTQLPSRRRQFGPFEAYFVRIPLNQRSAHGQKPIATSFIPGMQKRRDGGAMDSFEIEGNSYHPEHSIHESAIDSHEISEGQKDRQDIQSSMSPPTGHTLRKIEADGQQDLKSDMYKSKVASISRKPVEKGGIFGDDVVGDSRTDMDGITECQGECFVDFLMKNSTFPFHRNDSRSTPMRPVGTSNTFTAVSPVEFNHDVRKENLDIRDIKKDQHLDPRNDNKLRYYEAKINITTLPSTPPTAFLFPFPTPPQLLPKSDDQLENGSKARNSARVVLH